jgi:hypothetical protein
MNSGSGGGLERLRPYQGLGMLLLIALLVRLAIAPYGGYQYDIETFRSWAVQLTSAPPWDFYELQPPPDKLPGDLWLLWGIGHVHRLFSGDPQLGGEGFTWLVKLLAGLGDVAVAGSLYVAALRLAGHRVGVTVAAVYAFNPASIYLSSVWGQLDSIPLAAAIGGVALLLSGHRRLAFPAVMFAALIKPQYAALIPILALAVLWPPRDEAETGAGARGPAAGARDIAVGGALSLVLAAAIALPFGVGVPPLGEWSILERVQVAVDKWPFASLYALNVWTAIDPPVRGIPPDSKEWLFGMSYRTWGIALTAVSYAGVLGTYAAKRDTRTLLWALTGTMFLLFLFPTRVHERYMFPVVGLLVLLLPYGSPYRLAYAGASVACLLNLYFAYSLVYPPFFAPQLARSEFFYTYTSMLNLALFFVLACLIAFGDRASRARR